MAGPDYPVTGKPVQCYIVNSGGNWPERNWIVQLPDIQSNPTNFHKPRNIPEEVQIIIFKKKKRLNINHWLGSSYNYDILRDNALILFHLFIDIIEKEIIPLFLFLNCFFNNPVCKAIPSSFSLIYVLCHIYLIKKCPCKFVIGINFI